MRLDHLPTAVYRLCTASGEVLYVGITADLKQRFADHRNDKPWWSEVRWASVEWFEDRPTAARVEAEQIAAEDPPYNRLGTDRYDKHAMRDRVKDGVRELSLTLLAKRMQATLDEVRYGRCVTLLVKYGRPHVYLVPPKTYDRDRALLEALEHQEPELYARLLAEVS